MIGKKYNEILKKLESNIDSKKQLEFVKNQIADLSMTYVDEITKLTEAYTSKINSFNERLVNLEKRVDGFEVEEIHLSETICCPYCNFNFQVEYDDANREITCPECNNLIELDWGDFEDDM